MARPRTPIGTFGKISHRRLGKGRCEARARYRDWDGVLRAVQCTGPTAAAAELALKRKLSERSLFQPSFIELSADSRFSALIDYWLEDMEIEDRLSRTTRLLYERNMLTLVAPAFAELDGVLPGWGPQRRCWWGLGPELKGDKDPHWSGSTASPNTYGHFGGSGTFLWVDPAADLTCVVLTDREFGDWAVRAWPGFSERVRSTYSAAPPG